MTTKRTSKASEEKPKVKQRPTIYVGPNLNSLSKNKIFKCGELMPHVQQLIDECPVIKQLIVPVTELGATQEKLKDSSSVESSFYKKVENHFRKGAK